MAGFVKEVAPRAAAIREIAVKLEFPWTYRTAEVPLEDAIGRRCAEDAVCREPYPPFDRSLRDGYAVDHRDASGASPGTPLFLSNKGDVLMGKMPSFRIGSLETCSIPTGGIMPEGADAVVMLEDTAQAGGWVEIRRGVQAGENVIKKGEEIAEGERLLAAGSLIDFKTIGNLAAIGVAELPIVDLRISILSTGDEIVPVTAKEVPVGAIRDVNGWNIKAMLSRYGFKAEYRGVVGDDADEFGERFHKELDSCDVLVLSGGSSVGVRDNCSHLLESMPAPGLLVRGLNIAPGKPTLIAADKDARKLVVSLPGHPLSCLAVAFTVLIPLLLELIGARETLCTTLMPIACDLTARTGPEEFVPCIVRCDGKAVPLPAKSGYVSILSEASGFIRVPEDKETMRTGEETEVWLW